MEELARDMIVKSKQIEVLITTLPGIGVSEDDQQARLRSLLPIASASSRPAFLYMSARAK